MNYKNIKNIRQIRVFISSTFVDMVEDRNYLVKFIFPKLRRLCESRGVTFGEVDLRWGISEEDAHQGKVLPMCLAEIDKSRPYFIGLLGDRYGWIPKKEDYNLSLIPRPPWSEDFEGEKSDWLKKYQWKKSATELEILYGVLEAKGMENRAFFYFRDLNYTWPGKYVYKRQSDEDQQSLVRLKNNIKSNFPVKDGYDSLEDLGEWVLRDFTDFINKNWPEDSQPSLLDREAMDHEAFALSRKRAYIGREEYYRKLDAHADGLGNQPLVVVGESGSGKSALLGNWALRYKDSQPDAFLLLHFIGGTPQSSDWASMLRRILGEFNRKFGINLKIPDHPDALRAVFANSLYMVAAKHRVVIILDALNQLEDREGAQDLVWLPPFIPDNIRLIVSTLSGRTMEAIEKNGWQLELKIETLGEDERKLLIKEFLGDYGKNVPEVVEMIAEHKGTRTENPLFLRALLEELRVFGDHERLKERVTHYLLATSIPDLFDKILTRWEEDYGRGIDLVRRSMTLLWAARRGLSETEILEAMGEVDEPMPHAYWSPIFLAAGDSLVNRGGLLTFFHDYLREAVRKKYLPTEEEQKEAHRGLADYFERHHVCNFDYVFNEIKTKLELHNKDFQGHDDLRLFLDYLRSLRAFDELPWQLTKSNEWEKLFNLLSDIKTVGLFWIINEFELKTYWARLEEKSYIITEAYQSILTKQPQISEESLECHPFFLANISELLVNSEYPEEALMLYAYIADYYYSGKNNAKYADIINCMANILKNQNKNLIAVKLYKKAYKIQKNNKNIYELACVYNNIADILLKYNKHSCALKLYLKALVICEQEGRRSDQVYPLTNIGRILRRNKKFDEAIEYYDRAERLCLEDDNRFQLAWIINNRGTIYSEMNDYVSAYKSYSKAEEIFSNIGAVIPLKDIRKNIKNLFDAWTEDLDYIIQSGDENKLYQMLLNRVDVLDKRDGDGDLEDALVLLKQAELISQKIAYEQGVGYTQYRQGLLFMFKLQEFGQGIALIEGAYKLACEGGLEDLKNIIEPRIPSLIELRQIINAN